MTMVYEYTNLHIGIQVAFENYVVSFQFKLSEFLHIFALLLFEYYLYNITRDNNAYTWECRNI